MAHRSLERALIDGEPAPVKLTYKDDFVLKEEEPRGPIVNFEGIVRDRSARSRSRT